MTQRIMELAAGRMMEGAALGLQLQVRKSRRDMAAGQAYHAPRPMTLVWKTLALHFVTPLSLCVGEPPSEPAINSTRVHVSACC